MAPPFNTYLAQKSGGEIQDLGHKMVIDDDGVGITYEQVNDWGLKVGINRRRTRGDATAYGLWVKASSSVITRCLFRLSGQDRRPG
ncbi:MAG TPA: hypothetical protein VGL40_14030 [Bacillota bacterium]